MFKNTILIYLILNLFFTTQGFCTKFYFRRIAFLPLKNISGTNNIPQDIVNHIAKALKKKHHFDAVLPSDLEDFLLRNRVRRMGVITQAQAQGLMRQFGVDGAIITWLDLYDKGENPKIGIGIKVIETSTGTVVWGNYVSLTGQDFTSFFGLGKVTSIKQLSNEAIKRLIKNFPSSFEIQTASRVEKTSFAIERFSLSPLVTQGGLPVVASLRLVSLLEPPKEIALLLGGKEWPLEKRGNGWWKGEIEAPKRQGRYFVRLKLFMKNGMLSFLDTATSLKVDNTPPQVRLSFENKVFSPNGDGIKDVLIVFPELLVPDDIKVWGFHIYNQSGEIVRQFEGSGDLPHGLAWHGENDEFGRVDDGIYCLEFRCQDKAGNIMISKKTEIVVDNTAPQLNISVNIAKKKAKFEIKCQEENGIDKWQLTIMDKEENIYKMLEGKGKPPPMLESPLFKKKGLYFIIEAFDLAGNKAEYKGPLITQQITTTKPEKKEKVPIGWDYNF